MIEFDTMYCSKMLNALTILLSTFTVATITLVCIGFSIIIGETNVSSIPFWIGSFVCASIAIFSAFKFFPAYQEQKEREKRNDTMYK